MRNTSLLAVLLLAIAMQACGLRGPLYLPEPAKEVSAPADTKEPAQVQESEEEKAKKKSEQPAPPAPTQEPQ